MSGGGGGDETWRKIADPGAKTGAAADPCAIDEITVLNSPNRAVLTTLAAGATLTLDFQPGPPRRLVAITSGREIAGSITSISLPQLIQCIGQGVIFVADILNLTGAVCQVRVHRS
jgi:hypothetical protein